MLADGKHVSHIVHFGDQQVFEGATNYTCLLFLEKSGSSNCDFVKVEDLELWRNSERGTRGKITASSFGPGAWNLTVGEGARLFGKLGGMPVKLADLAERIAQGIRTSDSEVYVLELVSAGPRVVTAHSDSLDRNVKLERNTLSLFLQGREIKPYRITPSGKVVIIPYEIKDGRVSLIPSGEMKGEFPKTHPYLLGNKTRLENRERGRMRGSNVYPKNIEVMKAPKILVPDIADRASFALATSRAASRDGAVQAACNGKPPDGLTAFIRAKGIQREGFTARSMCTFLGSEIRSIFWFLSAVWKDISRRHILKRIRFAC